MKRWFAALVIAILVLAALVWFMPARWALPWLQAQLRGVRVEGVSGTVWEGRAEQVSIAGGPQLGSLAWTLSHRALLGQIRAHVDLRQPQLRLQGQLERASSTQIDLSDVTLTMAMSMLGPQPLLRGQPQGQLDLQAPQVQLQGYWPMQLDAAGTWSHAVMRTPAGHVPLGTLRLAVTGQAGVLHATLSDDGTGAVQTAGRLSLSPLGWDLDLRLVPRRDDPVVRPWLESLGKPAADGTLELRYRGGLAQWNTTRTS
ncbi:type II secretion system protein N [Dyella monticola]|uniref:Type II secretion system protein N n=1 Tax=Dyella monticola TaxID=1927958 RepID=A0A370X8G7_9GAMM|nr:type II secretion system protein N [Dyella monticola]RDS84656.1 type II secretion system protein N [Dyella monticola]